MSPLGLFEGYGVEIEYMIVDAESLDVRPVCDRLMEAVAGEPVAEVERGALAWSNELALHVLELKTNGPAAGLEGLRVRFHDDVLEANTRLAPLGARLLSGAVHPWMNPLAELRIWPHEHNDVYRAFDRIFGCDGHGWANLQSTHLNLPFRGDEEFRRLHAAVRVALPLIPALAAASPVLDGRVQPVLDARLAAYRDNARRVPSVTGAVVPEPIDSEERYRDEVLGRIYTDLEPLDPEGVLRHEWVNARGAIARFERGSLEVRVIDAQECPGADLAIVGTVTAVVRALSDERWASTAALDAVPTGVLAELLDRTIREGDRAVVVEEPLLGALGWRGSRATAGRLWSHLVDRLLPDEPGAGEWEDALSAILGHGPLARRLLDRLTGAREPGPEALRACWARLAECLADDRPLASER